MFLTIEIGALAVLDDLLGIALEHVEQFVDLLASTGQTAPACPARRAVPRAIRSMIANVLKLLTKLERILISWAMPAVELAERGELFGLHRAGPACADPSGISTAPACVRPPWLRGSRMNPGCASPCGLKRGASCSISSPVWMSIRCARSPSPAFRAFLQAADRHDHASRDQDSGDAGEQQADQQAGGRLLQSVHRPAPSPR